ncbi:hypothetical protein ACFYKT_04470 [Cytobacillus sp. FJAT-53684]|uniref:Uncharacterized protein n=1 Tax=Cytobacillus mangrovibacter TaxID=3299024 RepID=A0ABW6JXV8_9BACI
MDYIKRFIIAAIMVACVSLLFLGGKNTQAGMIELNGTINEVSEQ